MKMTMLTQKEREFLDVFLHEATTAPFTGPATKALHAIGAEYGDVLNLAWAYNREVGMTNYGWGHAAEIAPPLPWPNRDAVLKRDLEIQRIGDTMRNNQNHDPNSVLSR